MVEKGSKAGRQLEDTLPSKLGGLVRVAGGGFTLFHSLKIVRHLLLQDMQVCFLSFKHTEIFPGVLLAVLRSLALLRLGGKALWCQCHSLGDLGTGE